MNKDSHSKKCREYYVKHKKEISKQHHEYYEENKEKLKTDGHNYYLQHREKRKITDRAYRLKNKEKYAAYKRKYYLKNKEECDKRAKDNMVKLKHEVFLHYSPNGIKCERCSYNGMRALSIDHINGGGNTHRRSLVGNARGGGIWFYRWLKKNNYPLGFRVLCMNCQFEERCDKNGKSN